MMSLLWLQNPPKKRLVSCIGGINIIKYDQSFGSALGLCYRKKSNTKNELNITSDAENSLSTPLIEYQE